MVSHRCSGGLLCAPGMGLPQAVLPSLKEWALLGGISVASFIYQLTLNRGFQLESAAKASAMNYTQASNRQIVPSYMWSDVESSVSLAGHCKLDFHLGISSCTCCVCAICEHHVMLADNFTPSSSGRVWALLALGQEGKRQCSMLPRCCNRPPASCVPL